MFVVFAYICLFISSCFIFVKTILKHIHIEILSDVFTLVI